MTVSGSAVLARAYRTPAPVVVAGLAFFVCFWHPLVTLGRDWWSDPNASHGLLLAPGALFLAYRRGLVEQPVPQHGLGLAMLVAAVLLRYLSGLAAELFTMRLSLVGAGMALITYVWGLRQLQRWWLPLVLIVLSIPLPAVVLGSIALPLQLKASQWGAALLESRHVPVRLDGNVILLPGRALFVSEACSGLRSLTALTALGFLAGGLWLRHGVSRAALVLLAVPVAMVLNAIRVFLTGFLVYFVNPAAAEGFMHYSEGWAMFVVAFAILTVFAVALGWLEQRGRKAVA